MHMFSIQREGVGGGGGGGGGGGLHELGSWFT
jgi:hypothetical protein